MDESKDLSSIIIETLRTKSLTVERLSQLSGVSERFLTLLIEGKIEKMPSRPYTHGYLLKIAGVLNLDGERLWQEYLKNNESVRRSGKNDQLPKNRFAIERINRKTLAITGIILIILGYLLTRLPSFFGKPELSLVNLDNETNVAVATFIIQGKMNPSDQLTLNGERLYPDKDGKFEKSIQLQPGFNTLTFSIKKLLGKEYIINKQIFYKQTNPEPQENPPQTLDGSN